MVGYEKHFQNVFVNGLEQSGWIHSGPEDSLDYNCQSAIIPSDLKQWILSTHLDQWEQLVDYLGDENLAFDILVDEIVKVRKTSPSIGGGTYNLLLNGLEIDTIQFDFFKNKPPLPSISPENLKMYDNMIFRVVSELHYSEAEPNSSLDLTFFINGIPVGTVGLKESQGVSAAEKHYGKDRMLEQEMILNSSAGALFHFAVATDRASLTTALCGDETRFMPFNTGIDNSDYLKENPGDFATAYLWKEVLTKSNLSLIIFGMMRNVEENGIFHTRFPRYHQLDNLKKITIAVQSGRERRNYLSQHAPGSGKSDEIANLAYALSNMYNNSGKLMYSSIIIITNRKVLDSQIRDLFLSKIKVGGYFHPVVRGHKGSKSVELANKLLSENPPRIISVTAQTFTDTLLDTIRKEAKQGRKLSGSYAIIIDEAHDGEVGKQHRKMYASLLGETSDHDAPANMEESAAGSADPTMNHALPVPQNDMPALNFFAYTATPHAGALRVFGESKTDEAGEMSYEPFHTYSMKQAREEGYINDVLENYVTHYRSVKVEMDESSYQGDEIVDFTVGRKEIKKWIGTAPEVKDVLVKIIIQKMREIVIPSLGGEGKAMLTCSSRKDALAYKQLIDAAIELLPEEERFDTLVAYSGKLSDRAIDDEVSELDPRVNKGLGQQKDIAEAFKGKNFRLMIVADKYQVGFDQPKLVCMFLDKKLRDINLIQTTARVNRKIPGKDKVYIFDFVNKKEEIIESFRKFDKDATLSLTYDLDLTTETLDEILDKSCSFGVHTKDDVETFSVACMILANPNLTANEKAKANAQMTNIADFCSNKFHKEFNSETGNSNNKSAEYKALLRKFNSIYSLLSITRNTTEETRAIHLTYGNQSHFFDSLLKAIIASTNKEPEFFVDLNGLRLQKCEITPQSAIGGLTEGDFTKEQADYSGKVTIVEFSSEIGPIHILIDEINERLELNETAPIETQGLFKAVALDAKLDENLLDLAKSKNEASFIESRRVRNIVFRLLSKQAKNNDPEISDAATIVSGLLDDDSIALKSVTKMLHNIITLDSATSENQKTINANLTPENELPSWFVSWIRFAKE